MEDQTSILTGSLQADPFETQIRGYHRRQVEDYVKRTQELTATLEARLAAALGAEERARLELAAVQEQRQPSVRPAHEEVSERLSQILRLAAEEAEQERGRAAEEITRQRAAARGEVERLLSSTRAEVDGMLSVARAEADDEIGRAQEESQRLITSASEESQRLMALAHEDAERLVAEAREYAERLRGETDRWVAAVNGRFTERVESLVRAHSTTLTRLERVRDTLADLLTAEAVAGPVTVQPVALDEEALAAAVDDIAGAGEVVAVDGMAGGSAADDTVEVEGLDDAAAGVTPDADAVVADAVAADAVAADAVAADAVAADAAAAAADPGDAPLPDQAAAAADMGGGVASHPDVIDLRDSSVSASVGGRDQTPSSGR